MGLTQIHLIAVYSIAVVLVAALTFVSGDDIILQKRLRNSRFDANRLLAVEDQEKDPDGLQKRPFCNAFTGCVGKRSDESIDTLLELDSEPAVDDLRKRILSEAKLREAIQEARAEMERRQERRLNMNSRFRPLTFGFTGRRKRAATALDEKTTNH